jgi:RimJ/RimL family protein N-acetyltransferase
MPTWSATRPALASWSGTASRRFGRSSSPPSRRVDGDELAERRAAAERSGYRLAPYAEVDVHALFALELSLSADEPGEDEPRQLTFEEWREDLFDGPDMTQEGSFAVVSAGEPVSYAALSVEPSTGRGRNEGTATAAAHRDRGFATLAKLAQLRWAAANGIDRVVTDNDERNAPMLAINRRLGYEPFTERRGFLKER